MLLIRVLLCVISLFFWPCGAEIDLLTQLGPGLLTTGEKITRVFSKSVLTPGFFRKNPGDSPGKKKLCYWPLVFCIFLKKWQLTAHMAQTLLFCVYLEDLPQIFGAHVLDSLKIPLLKLWTFTCHHWICHVRIMLYTNFGRKRSNLKIFVFFV